MSSLRPLPPALAEVAREELGESPARLAAALHDLRAWARAQPHLRARTDEQWLAAFVRGCKYRAEAARAKLDLYYSTRSLAPELSALRHDDPRVADVLDTGAVFMLPDPPGPGAPRISVLRIGAYEPKQHSIVDVMAVYNFINQISFMEDDHVPVGGIINIIDLRGSRFAHYTQPSLRQSRDIIRANQDALPVRIRQVHIVGAPYIFYSILKLLKRFLSEKIRNRFHMHPDAASLTACLAPALLPPELGGCGPNLRDVTDHWKQKIVEYREFFEEDLQYGTDEQLRGRERTGKANLERAD